MICFNWRALVAISASLQVVGLPPVAAGPAQSVVPPPVVLIDSSKQRRDLTVRVMAVDQNGSGVIINKDQNGAWIVTNRHVVGTSTTACIVTTSGQYHEAAVYSRKGSPNDLAFALIPGAASDLPSTAVLASRKYSDVIANVTATGFSAPEYTYTESIGLTLPILDKPVQGGYGLVYSSQINKGMSGGGVFNQKGELIGINANHGDPLWVSEWLDAKGKPLDKDLSEKLDAASVGITSNLISAEFRRVLNSYVGPPRLGKECQKN